VRIWPIKQYEVLPLTDSPEMIWVCYLCMIPFNKARLDGNGEDNTREDRSNISHGTDVEPGHLSSHIYR